MPADNKIPGLNHLRALAITLVFLFHYRLFAHPAWIVPVGSFGWTGVDLFFVLSGYLIASQVFKSIGNGTFSIRTFFIKRFFRILPAYWVVLTVYFAFPYMREWEALSPLWKFLTFTQNFGLDVRTCRTFSHAWSLCIEEQFYFLLPFTVLLLHRAKAHKAGYVIVAALFVLGFVIRLASWNIFAQPVVDTDVFGATWFKWMYYPTYTRLDGLLAGISIAGIFYFKPRIKEAVEKRSNLLLLTGLALACTAYFVCADLASFTTSIVGFPLVAIAYGCIVASAVCRNSVLNRFPSFITSQIATLSYSIYLVHKIAIHFTQLQFAKLNIPADGNLMFILNIIVSLSFALLLHYSVERPFLRLKELVLAHNKRGKRK